MSDESSKLSKAETEQVLMQMTDEWAKALVRGDGEALGRIMAEDFYFAYPFEGDGKEQFIDDVTSGDVKVEHLNRDNVSVRIWDRTAIATCKDSTRWFTRDTITAATTRSCMSIRCEMESGNLFRFRPALSLNFLSSAVTQICMTNEARQICAGIEPGSAAVSMMA